MKEYSWGSGGLNWKLLNRNDLIEFGGGAHPYELIGINPHGVREFALIVDRQFGRKPYLTESCMINADQLLLNAPAGAKNRLKILIEEKLI